MEIKACAFTGYRPHKLPFGDNETHPACEQLKQRLFCEILRLTREDVKVFISGMARGVDTWAAETVLLIRDTVPARALRLWAAIPYDQQAAAWSEAEQARYHRILDQADKVEYINHAYTSQCLMERNRHMVDNATHLIAVYDGQPGGTRNTIEYARSKGLGITIIEP